MCKMYISLIYIQVYEKICYYGNILLHYVIMHIVLYNSNVCISYILTSVVLNSYFKIESKLKWFNSKSN